MTRASDERGGRGRPTERHVKHQHHPACAKRTQRAAYLSRTLRDRLLITIGYEQALNDTHATAHPNKPPLCTLSQSVRAFGMRRSRYVGLAKTGLQQVCTATAINVARIENWLGGMPRAKTRISRFTALAQAA